MAYQMTLDVDDKRDNIVAMFYFIKQNIANSKRLYKEAVNGDGLMPMRCIRTLRGYAGVLQNEHLINGIKNDDLLKKAYKETFESLCELEEAMSLNKNNIIDGYYLTKEMIDDIKENLKKFPLSWENDPNWKPDPSASIATPKNIAVLAGIEDKLLRGTGRHPYEIAAKKKRLTELVETF